MADSRPAQPAERALFTAPDPGPVRHPILPWLIAAALIALMIAVIILVTRHRPVAVTTLQAAAPYASSLVLSEVQMSESSALSGVKVTYIDGIVRNTGLKTVTGATAQVQFANDEQLAPQLETVPFTLIRTRQPYIDTEPIIAGPITPGGQREFRLIFENIASNWNQQLPVIRLTEITTR